MEFPAHIVFSCLLVCQPAIFVDSKRDGTGAAHGRKGFRMKRAELDRRIANGETLDDIVPALMDDGADITSYDDLKRFTIEKIESDTCLGRVKCCFSHALIFAAQVCAIYVVILLSGLLVFWSAIFIDSKGRKFSRQEDSRILRKRHREIGKTMAINRVTIMGNLTRDAELRKKGDATSVLTFGLAINEKKKDSETGEYVDAPVFVDCALFGARAEALAPYLTKGKKVSVDGRLRYHSWMKNEEKRHALSVLVTDIEFADSKGAGKDTVSAQGQSAEPETYDADIPF